MGGMLIARIDDLELRLLEEGDARHLAAMEPGDLSYNQGEWACPPGQHASVVSQKSTANREGTAVFCGIWREGQLVGLAGLQNINKHNQTASLDYGVDARFRSQGIATRACRALINYGFQEAGLNRIQIEVDVFNLPSCAVAERLGFVKEGIIRDRYKGVDGFHHCALYSALAREWQTDESRPAR
jgi:ribosomal-protein-serine acetyltransferase